MEFLIMHRSVHCLLQCTVYLSVHMSCVNYELVLNVLQINTYHF